MNETLVFAFKKKYLRNGSSKQDKYVLIYYEKPYWSLILSRLDSIWMFGLG